MRLSYLACLACGLIGADAVAQTYVNLYVGNHIGSAPMFRFERDGYPGQSQMGGAEPVWVTGWLGTSGSGMYNCRIDFSTTHGQQGILTIPDIARFVNEQREYSCTWCSTPLTNYWKSGWCITNSAAHNRFLTASVVGTNALLDQQSFQLAPGGVYCLTNRWAQPFSVAVTEDVDGLIIPHSEYAAVPDGTDPDFPPLEFGIGSPSERVREANYVPNAGTEVPEATNSLQGLNLFRGEAFSQTAARNAAEQAQTDRLVAQLRAISTNTAVTAAEVKGSTNWLGRILAALTATNAGPSASITNPVSGLTASASGTVGGLVPSLTVPSGGTSSDAWTLDVPAGMSATLGFSSVSIAPWDSDSAPAVRTFLRSAFLAFLYAGVLWFLYRAALESGQRVMTGHTQTAAVTVPVVGTGSAVAMAAIVVTVAVGVLVAASAIAGASLVSLASAYASTVGLLVGPVAMAWDQAVWWFPIGESMGIVLAAWAAHGAINVLTFCALGVVRFSVG